MASFHTLPYELREMVHAQCHLDTPEVCPYFTLDHVWTPARFHRIVGDICKAVPGRHAEILKYFYAPDNDIYFRFRGLDTLSDFLNDDTWCPERYRSLLRGEVVFAQKGTKIIGLVYEQLRWGPEPPEGLKRLLNIRVDERDGPEGRSFSVKRNARDGVADPAVQREREVDRAIRLQAVNFQGLDWQAGMTYERIPHGEPLEASFSGDIGRLGLLRERL